MEIIANISCNLYISHIVHKWFIIYVPDISESFWDYCLRSLKLGQDSYVIFPLLQDDLTINDLGHDWFKFAHWTPSVVQFNIPKQNLFSGKSNFFIIYKTILLLSTSEPLPCILCLFKHKSFLKTQFISFFNKANINTQVQACFLLRASFAILTIKLLKPGEKW